MNNSAQNTIRNIFVISVFLFPLLYFKAFLFPAVYSHTVFIFFIAELLLLLYLWDAFRKGKFEFKKSYITIALLAYIAVLFITALTGVDFGKSFWSSYSRMTGIVTWLHYFALFFVVSSVFKQADLPAAQSLTASRIAQAGTAQAGWKYVFRAVMLSGVALALTSWIGEGGFNTGMFPYLKDGSFLGNESYSGAYFLLAFFLSFIGITFETNPFDTFNKFSASKLRAGKIWRWIYISAFVLIFFNPDLFNFRLWSGETLNPIGGARASSLVLWLGIAVLGILFAAHKFARPVRSRAPAKGGSQETAGAVTSNGVKNRKFVAGTAIVIILAILGVYTFVFTSILSGEGPLHDKFLEIDGPARLILWDVALDGIKERPILGYGHDNFDYVFDKWSDSKIITLTDEFNLSFDRAHNLIIDTFVGVGVFGMLAMFLIFIAATYKSIRLYVRENKFYFLIIPFILVFHFLQLQTFFEGPGSLLLAFIILAFLVSHGESSELKIPLPANDLSRPPAIARHKRAGRLWQAGTLSGFILIFYFWVYIPTAQNMLYIKLASGATVQERQQLLPQLKELKVDPIYTINLLSDGLIRGAARYRDRLDEPGVRGALRGEFKMFLDIYESYALRYEDNYKYFFQYGKVINAANAVGIDELKRGEEIIRKAITISDKYPHPYSLLAFNLYFQGRYDEALEAARIMLEIEPSLRTSKKLYDLILSRELQPL